jgi:hypothetical protein
MATKNIKDIVEKHIFVKFGSSAIDEKIGKVLDITGLKYIHCHDGHKPKPENRIENNYNRNMKIKSCAIYKLRGNTNQFGILFKNYTNLEEISDTN